MIVMEGVNKLLTRSRELGLFSGLKMGEGEMTEEITYLFFANDILLFCQLEERSLLNLRCVLLCF